MKKSQNKVVVAGKLVCCVNEMVLSIIDLRNETWYQPCKNSYFTYFVKFLDQPHKKSSPGWVDGNKSPFKNWLQQSQNIFLTMSNPLFIVFFTI